MTADRIMHRLQKAEWAEPSPWFRQDYRQAFICVSLASKGGQQPFIESSYKIYGTHPDKVWTKIMANRRAKLGKEFSDWYDQAGNLKPDIPSKKPSMCRCDEAERRTNERLAAVLAFAKKLPHSVRILPVEEPAA